MGPFWDPTQMRPHRPQDSTLRHLVLLVRCETGDAAYQRSVAEKARLNGEMQALNAKLGSLQLASVGLLADVKEKRAALLKSQNAHTLQRVEVEKLLVLSKSLERQCTFHSTIIECALQVPGHKLEMALGLWRTLLMAFREAVR